MERIVHCVHVNQMTVGICSSVIQTVGQGLLISAQKRSAACLIKTPSRRHNSAFHFFLLLPLPLIRTKDFHVCSKKCSNSSSSSSSSVLLLCWLLFNLKCGPCLVLNACYRLFPEPPLPKPCCSPLCCLSDRLREIVVRRQELQFPFTARRRRQKALHTLWSSLSLSLLDLWSKNRELAS